MHRKLLFQHTSTQSDTFTQCSMSIYARRDQMVIHMFRATAASRFACPVTSLQNIVQLNVQLNRSKPSPSVRPKLAKRQLLEINSHATGMYIMLRSCKTSLQHKDAFGYLPRWNLQIHQERMLWYCSSLGVRVHAKTRVKWSQGHGKGYSTYARNIWMLAATFCREQEICRICTKLLASSTTFTCAGS